MPSLEKPREQICGIVGGQIVPATETPLLTSASTPWSGFLLEKHNAGDRQDICWGWHRAHVSLITKGQLGFHVGNSGGNQDFVARAGSVCVFPSGYDETRFAIAGSKFEAIVVELDPARLETLLGRPASASTDTLAPQIVVRDRYMAMLLRAMASEVAQGCPAGALYGQALSLGLATYLERRFSVKGRAEKKRHLRLVWAKSLGPA
jgi:AraC family transcriptional regulator